MDGHKAHLVLSFVERIGIGEQRHMGKVVLKRHLLPAVALELVDRLFELCHVVEPLLASLRAKRLFVAAFVDERRKHLRHRPALERCAELADERHELLRLRALEYLVVDRLLERLEKRARMRFGVVLEKRHAALPEIALGNVCHAHEGKIVLVRDKPQVSQGVLDFLAPVERHARIHRMRDLGPQERFLHRARCVVRTIEHRHIAIAYAPIMERTHPFGNPFRLVFGSFRVMPHRKPVLGATCAQVLRDALAVLLDKRVCHRDDLGGRAVVLKHHDGARPRERLVEIEKEAHVSAAPGVDGLVGVAHHEQVFVVAGKHAHKLVLQLIDVLELVDHDVFQALLPFQPNVRVLIEYEEHDDNKVVVVESEALLLLV